MFDIGKLIELIISLLFLIVIISSLSLALMVAVFLRLLF